MLTDESSIWLLHCLSTANPLARMITLYLEAVAGSVFTEWLHACVVLIFAMIHFKRWLGPYRSDITKQLTIHIKLTERSNAGGPSILKNQSDATVNPTWRQDPINCMVLPSHVQAVYCSTHIHSDIMLTYTLKSISWECPYIPLSM